MENLKSELINWLRRNGFDVMVGFTEDSNYDLENLVINLGTESCPDAESYFEQYLYEYGLEYVGILGPVLQFLHELGHHMTIKSFSREELCFYHMIKEYIDADNDQEWFNKYWIVPDELAANMWEINFINENIEVVEELCNIFIIECA